MNIKILILSRADVARMKTTAPRGDIWDCHMSHNVYFCTGVWRGRCVERLIQALNQNNQLSLRSGVRGTIGLVGKSFYKRLNLNGSSKEL